MKKHKKQQHQFVSGSEYTVTKRDIPENIPPTGPMKDNPVYFGKQKGVKPTKKLKRKLVNDSNDITSETVTQSADEDQHE